MSQLVPCKHCNSPFEVKPRKSYCSKECRYTSWVISNRAKLNAAVRRYRKKRYEEDGCWTETSPKAKLQREWINKLKAEPCMDCGQRFPTPCMDFDHREGTVKAYNVGSMVAHHYGRELIEAEIAKCDLVCANCHRLRTQKRRTGSALTSRK